MIQLNRSMMERYEIKERRPAAVRAALFGANRMTLGAAARLLDRANEKDSDLGAVCFTPAAAELRAQDCMFTLLIRGERDGGEPIREERVVQSVLTAFDPEAEFDELLECACHPELTLCFLSGEATAVEIALLARFLYARWAAKLEAPAVLLLSDDPAPAAAEELRAAIILLSRDWSRGAEFSAWLDGASIRSALVESLCGRLSEAERARAQREMNYRDDFLAWAEPQLRCVVDGGAPDVLASVCDSEDFELACARKVRVFDSLVFLCAATGFLGGVDSFAQTLRDEELRAFIARAFFDEILPALPWPREEIAPYVISCFSRLENPMNDVPLLDVGQNLLSNLPRAILPAVRAWAEREFDAPPRLALAISAAIMLYAGVRRSEAGEYEVLRGESRYALHDSTNILETFTRFSHDMPAETLAYAALADRDLWGEDLRELDGLEQRVAFDLSSIQRIGFRETLRHLSQ